MSEIKITINGKECVGLGIYKNSDANALDTVNKVKAEIEKILL